MIVKYECGCCGSGDNVTLNCPVHGNKIKHEKTYPAAEVERLVEAVKAVTGIVHFTKNYPIHDRLDTILDSIQKLKSALKPFEDGR